MNNPLSTTAFFRIEPNREAAEMQRIGNENELGIGDSFTVRGPEGHRAHSNRFGIVVKIGDDGTVHATDLVTNEVVVHFPADMGIKPYSSGKFNPYYTTYKVSELEMTSLLRDHNWFVKNEAAKATAMLEGQATGADIKPMPGIARLFGL